MKQIKIYRDPQTIIPTNLVMLEENRSLQTWVNMQHATLQQPNFH